MGFCLFWKNANVKRYEYAYISFIFAYIIMYTSWDSWGGDYIDLIGRSYLCSALGSHSFIFKG